MRSSPAVDHDIPDHDFFIRQIGGACEIGRHVAAVAAKEPRHLRARLETFKQRCAEVFSWQRAARSLFAAASNLAGTPRPEASVSADNHHPQADRAELIKPQGDARFGIAGVAG